MAVHLDAFLQKTQSLYQRNYTLRPTYSSNHAKIDISYIEILRDMN